MAGPREAPGECGDIKPWLSAWSCGHKIVSVYCGRKPRTCCCTWVVKEAVKLKRNRELLNQQIGFGRYRYLYVAKEWRVYGLVTSGLRLCYLPKMKFCWFHQDLRLALPQNSGFAPFWLGVSGCSKEPGLLVTSESKMEHEIHASIWSGDASGSPGKNWMWLVFGT